MIDIGCSPLRYLIGADDLVVDPLDGGIVEYSYDMDRPCRMKYGTLTSEKERFRSLPQANRIGRYRPYLAPSDITGDYGEWCPDPKGPGFVANVQAQIVRAVNQGVAILELDNADFDGLELAAVLHALDLAETAGLAVVAKNPLNTDDPEKYLGHYAVALAIVEEGDYGSDAMDELRRGIGKPELAVRFVGFGANQRWGQAVCKEIVNKGYGNMGVTWSPGGEYTGYIDLLKPWPAPPTAQLTRATWHT